MTNWAFTVGTKNESAILTWNPIGTLESLAITDGFNSGGTQTCSFNSSLVTGTGYDDLNRLIGVSCGSSGSIWNQTFSYDQYDNICKVSSGFVSWCPTYTQTTNHFTGTGVTFAGLWSGFSVRDADFNLPQHRHDLLWFVPLDGHDLLFLQVDSLSFHLVQISPVTSTDRKWEEGDEISVLEFAATEYGRKRKVVASEDVKTTISNIGINKCARESGFDRKNLIRKLVRGLPVKRNSYNEFVRWLQGYKSQPQLGRH